MTDLTAVFGNALSVGLAKESENLARLGVPAGGELGVQQLSVDDDIKDAFTAADDGRFGDDVLVGAKEILDRAHGVIRIVSTNAVFDADFVHRQSVPHSWSNQFRLQASRFRVGLARQVSTQASILLRPIVLGPSATRGRQRLPIGQRQPWPPTT